MPYVFITYYCAITYFFIFFMFNLMCKWCTLSSCYLNFQYYHFGFSIQNIVVSRPFGKRHCIVFLHPGFSTLMAYDWSNIQWSCDARPPTKAGPHGLPRVCVVPYFWGRQTPPDSHRILVQVKYYQRTKIMCHQRKINFYLLSTCI